MCSGDIPICGFLCNDVSKVFVDLCPPCIAWFAFATGAGGGVSPQFGGGGASGSPTQQLLELPIFIIYTYIFILLNN